MKYVNAFSVFPKKIVSELQKYIQGAYVYIPQKEGKRRSWGELTGWRTQVEKRNMRIREDFHRGISIETLAETYFLSEHTIKNIVYKK
jgi:Mor family transcriptional regulator